MVERDQADVCTMSGSATVSSSRRYAHGSEGSTRPPGKTTTPAAKSIVETRCWMKTSRPSAPSRSMSTLTAGLTGTDSALTTSGPRLALSATSERSEPSGLMSRITVSTFAFATCHCLPVCPHRPLAEAEPGSRTPGPCFGWDRGPAAQCNRGRGRMMSVVRGDVPVWTQTRHDTIVRNANSST